MEYFISILACFLVFIYFWKSRSRLPPGPWGLPVVGYIPFLTRKPYSKLQQLAKKYGNVFSISLGSHEIVVINDYQNTKEAFSREVFIARPPEFAFELTDVSRKTGAFLGPPWREQRRLSLHLLRDLGFGKSKMEGHIQEEIEELLRYFEKYDGQPFCPRDLLASSMSNNISALMFGTRYKYDDPLRLKMNKFVTETADAAGQTAWTLFFPWIKKFCQVLRIGDVNRVTRLSSDSKALFRKMIDEHEKTFNPENIRDFVDGYLLEIQKRKDEPTFRKEVLEDLVGAYFGAGSETVRTTVEWLILLVAHHQDQQRRLQAEIDEVIGRERLPIWPDQKNTPYVNAFIMEMQRWMPLLPLNLLRYTIAETELDGHVLPKHTKILSNLWSVHRDPEYWGEDVDEFKPERFLSEDGKTVKKYEHYIPFSTGRRSCPGEPLAKIEMYMYFTSILQRFNIKMPAGKEVNFDPVLGLSLRPVYQDVIMIKRN